MRYLITLFLLAGCAAHKPAPLPHYAAIATQGRAVADSVAQATSEGKGVRDLQTDALGLLDRLDYKATVLLEQ